MLENQTAKVKFAHYKTNREISYSKVPPLRNCVIRNSGLISLSMLVYVLFLLQWYIVVFYGLDLNISPIGLDSLETRMKVLNPNCYNFKKLSVLAQTISFLVQQRIF